MLFTIIKFHKLYQKWKTPTLPNLPTENLKNVLIQKSNSCENQQFFIFA